MKRHRMALLAFAVLAAACGDDDGDGTGPAEERFLAVLNGANERPTPVVTPATGQATFAVDGQTVDYAIEVDDISGVILAHIHLGTADVAGPIVVTLFEIAPPGTGSLENEELVDDSFTAADIQGVEGNPRISLDSLLVRMRNGSTYVNVHTVANPAGEIRGQVEED